MEHSQRLQHPKQRNNDNAAKSSSAKSIQNKRDESADQAQLMQDIENSPIQEKQKELTSNMEGGEKPAQLAAIEEEEPVQGKLIAQLQGLEEEEEPAQGKLIAQMQPEEEELLQGKFAVQRQAEEEEEPMQGKFDAATNQQAPVQRKGGLPDNLKSGVEQLSGTDMSDVKVHYNSEKPAQLNALAYAQGNDIHVGPGQEQHLPHEAWHVAQQRQGRVSPTKTVNGQPVNDNTSLEKEADVMGAKANRLP